MTEAIEKRVSEMPVESYWGTPPALTFVIATLRAADAVDEAPDIGGIDVERVFSTVEMLGRRDELEIAPFVASWHSAIGSLDHPTSLPTLAQKVKDEMLDIRHAGSIGLTNALTDFVEAVVGKQTGEVFTRTMGAMIRALKEIVRLDSLDRVSYLNPLIEYSRQHGPLTFATLNYDRSIEMASEHLSVPCETGIVEWSNNEGWNQPSAGIRLLKLHGSIDWTIGAAGGEPGTIRHTIIEVGESENGPFNTRPAIVFGQRGKLRAEGPFLELLMEFRKELDNADRLLAIGYSFRDDHVNEQIRTWLALNRDAKVVVLDPVFPGDRLMGQYSPDFRQELYGSLLRRQIPAFNDEFEERLIVHKLTVEEGLEEALGSLDV